LGLARVRPYLRRSRLTRGWHEPETRLDEPSPRLRLRHQRPGDERPDAAGRDRLGIVRIGLVEDQRTDQALVTVCYLARARPAPEAREHRIRRALDGAAADQGTDRDDTVAAALDHGP